MDGPEHQRGLHGSGKGNCKGSHTPNNVFWWGVFYPEPLQNEAETVGERAQHEVKKYSGSGTQNQGFPDKTKAGTGVGA